MKTFADFIKDLEAGDVHVSGAVGSKTKKPQAPVDYPDVKKEATWEAVIKITKVETDQQLVYGWASVIEKDGQVVTDSHGHQIDEQELVNAAHEFMKDFRVGGNMHENMNVSGVVESLVFTKELQKALGVDLKKVGWFVVFKVGDPETWTEIKEGRLLELSIGGAAIVEEM